MAVDARADRSTHAGLDIDAMAADVLANDLGFSVARGLLSQPEVDRFLAYADKGFRELPRIAEKPSTLGLANYVMPLVYDNATGEVLVERQYHFLDHPQLDGGCDEPERIIRKVLGVRDALESRWLPVGYYAEQSCHDVNMVTKYTVGAAYPLHADAPKDTPFPLLQTWSLLTEPGVDFSGGELLMHLRDGRVIRCMEELSLRPGDVLFFDRRLDHEVEASSIIRRGRWITLFGAKPKLGPKAA